MLVAGGRKKRRSVRLKKEQMLEEKGKGKKYARGRRRVKMGGKRERREGVWTSCGIAPQPLVTRHPMPCYH
jgi:hypothetical protein